MQAYFKQQFPSLPEEINEQVALRAVTHKSIAGIHEDHQSRLSFLGRRTLRFQLMLHLLESGKSVEDEVFRCLDTSKLGETIGNDWELERVMRWSTNSENSGVYKVRGSTVEAVVGAISHQYGQEISNKIFKSKILPKLGLY